MHGILKVISLSIYMVLAISMKPAERKVGVVPLAEAAPDRFGGQVAQSYGVFVGVDRFEDASIGSLNYAAADARAMRDCFVRELGYLPAKQARLLISGAEGEDRPTRANILKAVLAAAQAAGPQGCVVVHLSTHGIEGYVLGEDSQRVLLEDTAVPLARIQEILAKSPCPRRLLFFDACRENLSTGDTRSLGGGMSPAFARAFAGARGFAVLKSCSEGQFSYEMAEAGQGAFTHFLLEGLRGAAPAGANGLITVTTLAPWVKARVEEWSKGRPGGVQSPLFNLQEASGDLPLAASREGIKERTVRRLAEMLADGRLSQAQFNRAQQALESGESKARKVIEDLAAGRLAPEYLDTLLPTPVAVPAVSAEPSSAAATAAPVKPEPAGSASGQGPYNIGAKLMGLRRGAAKAFFVDSEIDPFSGEPESNRLQMAIWLACKEKKILEATNIRIAKCVLDDGKNYLEDLEVSDFSVAKEDPFRLVLRVDPPRELLESTTILELECKINVTLEGGIPRRLSILFKDVPLEKLNAGSNPSASGGVEQAGVSAIADAAGCDAMLEKGKLLLEQGRLAEAGKVFQAVLAFAQSDRDAARGKNTQLEANFWLGEMALVQKDYNGAEEAYRRVIDLEKQAMRAWESYERLGDIKVINGDRETALQIYDTILEVWKDKEIRYVAEERVRGKTAELRGEAAAATDYDTALAQGKSFFEQGRLDEAGKSLQTALDFALKDAGTALSTGQQVEANFWLGETAFAQQNYDKAKEYYTIGVQLDTRSNLAWEGYERLGDIDLILGDRAEALKIYQAILEMWAGRDAKYTHEDRVRAKVAELERSDSK